MTLHRTTSATLPTPLSKSRQDVHCKSRRRSASPPVSPSSPSSLYTTPLSAAVSSPTTSLPKPLSARTTTSTALGGSHSRHASLSSILLLNPADHPPLRLLTAASCLESLTSLVSAQSPPQSPTLTSLATLQPVTTTTTSSPVLASPAASIPSAPNSRASSIMDGIQTTLFGASLSGSSPTHQQQQQQQQEHSAAKESLSRVHRAQQQHQQRALATRRRRSDGGDGSLEVGASEDEQVSTMPRSRSDYFSFPSFEDVDFVFVALDQQEDEDDDNDHDHEQQEKKKNRSCSSSSRHSWHEADSYANATCQPLPNYEQLEQMQQRRKSSYPSMVGYYPALQEKRNSFDEFHHHHQQPSTPQDHQQQCLQQIDPQQRETDCRHPFKTTMSSSAEKKTQRGMMMTAHPAGHWLVQLEPYQELRVNGV